MVDFAFAAGMATEGYKPFCAIYSTFLQRAYDQVIHDVAIQNLPVRFMMDRAGLVGADGPTHAGAFDIAYLGCLPNMVVMAPGDERDLPAMLDFALAHDGPIFTRETNGGFRVRMMRTPGISRSSPKGYVTRSTVWPIELKARRR